MTTSTSGSSATNPGTSASNRSVAATLASNEPSSPAESVFLKCTKKKSKSAKAPLSIGTTAYASSAAGRTVIPTSPATPRYIGYSAIAAARSR